MYTAKINVKNDSEENVRYISGKFKNWNIVKDNIRDKNCCTWWKRLLHGSMQNFQYFCTMLTPRWKCHFKWHIRIKLAIDIWNTRSVVLYTRSKMSLISLREIILLLISFLINVLINELDRWKITRAVCAERAISTSTRFSPTWVPDDTVYYGARFVSLIFIR